MSSRSLGVYGSTGVPAALIRRVAFTEDERNAEAAGTPVEPYTPRDLELNWCPPCVCEQYGVEGCAGSGYVGPFV